MVLKHLGNVARAFSRMVSFFITSEKTASMVLEGIDLDKKRHADRITLSGVKLFPHIGIMPEERSSPQECRADLTMWGDFESAAITDSLDQSIDYCQVLATMQDSAEAKEYHLLETLAYEILRDVLRTYPIVRARIKLRKKPETLIKHLDFIEIEMEGLQQEN